MSTYLLPHPTLTTGAPARKRFRSRLAAMLIYAACLFTSVQAPIQAQSGCCTVRGNIDCSPDGIVDISDLTRLIDNLFISLDPLCCVDAANTDASSDGIVDISDLTVLIDNLFISLNPMTVCDTSELTDDQREVFLIALDSAAKTLDSLFPELLAVHLAAFLNSRPEIDSAGIIEDISVWAYFTDGRLISIPNNRPAPDSFLMDNSMPPAQFELAPPPGFVAPKRRHSDGTIPSPSLAASAIQTAANDELPSSIQARLISNFSPTCFPQSVSIIQNLLDQGGYVTQVTSGTVTNLLNVQDDGVFYLDTHGGAGVDRANNTYHALWTNSFYTRSNESAFASMLRNKELAYMYARDYNVLTNKCEAHWRYCITPAFVAQYMYFKPNSFVFINACMSDSIPALRNSFFTAGASTYCGFTRSVSFPGSNRMAEYVFDRMLGTNASTLSPRESPPQRPFNIDLIYTDMVNRQLDIDKDDPKFLNNARLRVRHLQANMGILAPSIRYMAIVESFDTLYITGTFGTDPGPSKRRVFVGGTDMLIYDWQPQLIICFIPNTGAGSVGPVHVEVDGLTGPSSSIKRKSNVVNITEWHGIFTYKQDDFESLEGKIVIDARLRADIHPFRDKPHETPKFYSTIFAGMDNSFGLASASGHAEHYWEGDPGYTEYWDWSGSHYIPGLWEQILDGFLMTGYVTQASKQFRLHIVAAENEGMNEHGSYSDGREPYDNDLAFHIPFCLYDAPPGYIYITMNDQWDLVGGQRSCNTCCSRNPANESGADDIIHTFSWPTIQSSWAPDTTQGL